MIETFSPSVGWWWVVFNNVSGQRRAGKLWEILLFNTATGLLLWEAPPEMQREFGFR